VLQNHQNRTKLISLIGVKKWKIIETKPIAETGVAEVLEF
jgi:hypothetical protein